MEDFRKNSIARIQDIEESPGGSGGGSGSTPWPGEVSIPKTVGEKIIHRGENITIINQDYSIIVNVEEGEGNELDEITHYSGTYTSSYKRGGIVTPKLLIRLTNTPLLIKGEDGVIYNAYLDILRYKPQKFKGSNPNDSKVGGWKSTLSMRRLTNSSFTTVFGFDQNTQLYNSLGNLKQLRPQLLNILEDNDYPHTTTSNIYSFNIGAEYYFGGALNINNLPTPIEDYAAADMVNIYEEGITSGLSKFPFPVGFQFDRRGSLIKRVRKIKDTGSNSGYIDFDHLFKRKNQVYLGLRVVYMDPITKNILNVTPILEEFYLESRVYLDYPDISNKLKDMNIWDLTTDETILNNNKLNPRIFIKKTRYKA